MAKTLKQIKRRAQLRGENITASEAQRRLNQSRQDSTPAISSKRKSAAKSRPQPQIATRRSMGRMQSKPSVISSAVVKQHQLIAASKTAPDTMRVSNKFITSPHGIRKNVVVSRVYNVITKIAGTETDTHIEVEVSMLGVGKGTPVKNNASDASILITPNARLVNGTSASEGPVQFLQFDDPGSTNPTAASGYSSPFYVRDLKATKFDSTSKVDGAELWGFASLTAVGLPPYTQSGDKIYGEPIFRITAVSMKASAQDAPFATLETVKRGAILDFSAGARLSQGSVRIASGTSQAGDLGTASMGQDWRVLFTPPTPLYANTSQTQSACY